VAGGIQDCSGNSSCILRTFERGGSRRHLTLGATWVWTSTTCSQHQQALRTTPQSPRSKSGWSLQHTACAATRQCMHPTVLARAGAHRWQSHLGQRVDLVGAAAAVAGALAQRQPHQAPRQHALQERLVHPVLQPVPPHRDARDVLVGGLLQRVVLMFNSKCSMNARHKTSMLTACSCCECLVHAGAAAVSWCLPCVTLHYIRGHACGDIRQIPTTEEQQRSNGMVFRGHLLITVSMPLIRLRLILIRLHEAGAALQGRRGVLITCGCGGHSPCNVRTPVLTRRVTGLHTCAISLLFEGAIGI
jgi:hypothetical protein